jgi:predicted lipoprotein with Yx(FWY)xxD motif
MAHPDLPQRWRLRSAGSGHEVVLAPRWRSGLSWTKPIMDPSQPNPIRKRSSPRPKPDGRERHASHEENPAMTVKRLLASAAPIAAALGLSACGRSGGNAKTPSPPPTHAAPRTVSRETGPRVAAPRSGGRVITVRTSRYGPILADGRDRTIYLFTRDRSVTSTCYGRCAAVWPPVLTQGAPGRAGRLPGVLSTTRRRNGTRQVTYDGHPLYYYTGDVTPGAILCQNVDEFGGTWLVVSPSGKPVR